MSSSYGNYYQHVDQGQLFVASNSFDYDQYDDQGPKTPVSLVNHSGLSPGPLSTPPRSRNPSQPPEQAPEQMIWDDTNGSPSNSPTSVRTPDNDSFEAEMLDAPGHMRDFYQNQNGGLLPNQAAHEPAPRALNSYQVFSDQYLHQTYTEVASQTSRYHQSQDNQNQPTQNVVPSQFYNTTYGRAYSHQPTHRDPWTSQRPPQNPEVPRSGDVIWDPQSDTLDYSQWVNEDVNIWTHNNTDPNYLISPNEPLPSQDTMFPRQIPIHTRHIPSHSQPPIPTINGSFASSSQHNLSQIAVQPQYNSHYQRPMEMRVTVPSPPSGSYTFINYDQNSSFSPDESISDYQYGDASPGTSAMGSSAAHYSQSPYQTAISPLPSVPSPGGSEGIFSSYQHSDSGMMMIDTYQNEQFDMKPAPPASPVHTIPTLSRAVSEGTADAPSEPDPDSQGHLHPAGKGTGRAGGRQLGTHLEPKVAKAAHDMRKIVACWHCVLQRDKCGPGDICERCMKRSQRPNADCGLGCSRVKLIELAESFLPTLITQIHEDSHLTHFVTQHIRQWGNTEITIYMTCGQAGMPRIPVKVYEFIPNGRELLVQIQYKTCQKTHVRVPVKKASPPLGMVHINHNEEKKYDRYINDIIDGHVDAFGEACWMEDDNDFQQKLFKLMMNVKAKTEDERKLLREVARLIVVTYIMSHTFTIAEENKHQSLSKMHNYAGPNSYVHNFTSPRMTNRQLKYFFCRLHRSIMSNVLNKLQQIFKSSKGCDKWLAAFVAVVGMCMAHEDQQKTVHLVMETKAVTEGWDRRDAQSRADIACREIDEKMRFITAVFRWKYNRKCNPLRDSGHDWLKEPGFGDEKHVEFVRDVAQLVKDNIDFLTAQQSVSISPANQTKYTTRLVAHFLLSFWLPS